MKLDRLFAITMLIINKKRVSALELSEYFEVSIRTIYRDIDSINMAGIPIVSYQGKNGGFEIIENFKFDKQLLTPKEITSIITALKGVGKTLGDDKINATMQKLQTLLPQQDADNYNNKKDLIIDFSPYINNKQKQILNILREAIEKKLLINLGYMDANGELTNRFIEPMTLILKGNVWYFYGFCKNRDDFRMFRLSRIKKIELTNTVFKRKEINEEDVNFEAYWQRLKSVNLILKFNKRIRVKVEDFFESEHIKEDNDYLMVNINFPEDEWLYGFILSFGGDVEVIAPDYIRNIIKEKAKNILEKY
ncbi:MAG: hypothetical protein A2086_00565 [Spirochaetes bacterium GWD1_27_9]|nr:MAG: hypothetical protein A2Z98_05075 [Spirochaetes bacterium GWB1_27_13]OHD25032.1 MAG: hypothetical protein A2Y34_03130 [Spirochaetes bacterium GWC1_27_15]OHD32503.1 MAG: hypothetical protein A2086_00565 [Spirochaetes bacterium GWD1_27_9]